MPKRCFRLAPQIGMNVPAALVEEGLPDMLKIGEGPGPGQEAWVKPIFLRTFFSSFHPLPFLEFSKVAPHPWRRSHLRLSQRQNFVYWYQLFFFLDIPSVPFCWTYTPRVDTLEKRVRTFPFVSEKRIKLSYKPCSYTGGKSLLFFLPVSTLVSYKKLLIGTISYLSSISRRGITVALFFWWFRYPLILAGFSPLATHQQL